MRNAGLEETQTGIKVASRNINHLRYADDTTLMAESEKELKSLLRVKEESEKAGLKLNIEQTKIMTGKVEAGTDFIFFSLSGIRIMSSAYLRLLIFLPAILIPACVSSSPAFLMMYSAYNA